MTNQKLWLCRNCETLQPLTQLTCEVCGEDIPLEFRQPVISEFKASAKQVRDNETIVISWRTEFAKYVSLNGLRVSANGTKEIPATDKVYLKVSNSNGSIEKKHKIKVIHALELNDFSTNEDNIQYGKDCIVTWNGRNVKRVYFRGMEFSPEGPIVFKPTESANYEVLFEGIDGDVTKRSFAIHVFYPSPITNLCAPSFAKKGELVHVEWNTEYVSSVIIDGVEQPLKGSFEWNFSQEENEKTVVFIDMEGKSHEHNVIVKEALPPTILAFKASTEEINDNELASLSWISENAKYVFLNGTRVSANGTKDLSAIESYTLKASNEFGSVESTLHVKVLHPIKITYFKANQTNLDYGTPCIVSWKGRNISKVKIDGEECGCISPIMFTPVESRTYFITFEGAHGQVIEKCIDIDITFPEPIFNIENSQYGKPGELVKVEWEMEYVKCVQIGDLRFSSKGSFEWKYEFDKCSKILHVIGLDGGTYDKIIRIRPARAPEILDILLSKDKYKIGDSCGLSWSGDYVDEWFIEGKSRQIGNVKSANFEIDSETIRIHFIGEEGTEITREVNVYIVHDPEVIECNFSPEVPVRGQLTRIEWKTKYVQKVKIGEASFFPEGHYEFVPYNNEDFQIRFIGETKHIVKDMHVVFAKIKILYFKSNSYNIVKGEKCIISWSAANVTRVEIKGKRFSAVSSLTYTPSTTETIYADFIGDDGTTERRSINIVVTIPEIQVFDVCVSKDHARYGESVTLTWRSNYVKYITISGVDGQLPPTGSKDIVVNENRRICFTFNGTNGEIKRKYSQINVSTPISNARIAANSQEVYPGQRCSVRWYAENAQYVIVNGVRYNMSESYNFYPKISESIKVVFYGIDGSTCERTIFIKVRDRDYGSKNNHGCIRFIVYLFILAMAFYCIGIFL